MAILTVLAATAAPRFSGFVEGRRYDAEWDRLMSLLRFARSEAVSRSVPVEVWFDASRGAYGLTVDAGTDPMSAASERILPENMTLEFSDAAGAPAPVSATGDGLARIVFRPDGSVDESSPEYVELRDAVEVRAARKHPARGYVPVETFEEVW